MKYLFLFVFATMFFALKAASFDGVKIPLGGNAFVTRSEGNVKIDDNGIVNWDKENAMISCWFKTLQGGKLTLLVQARITKGTSKILVSVNGKSTELDIKNTNWESIPAGSFDVPENEYVRVDLKGVSKTGPDFGVISDIIIEGEAATEPLVFVREPENFYFGRRGPSVHLSYEVPVNAGNIEYFYNEVTVPEGEDVIGSYFMVNGFAEGYCGIQVNSADERRILFSVWSPFETDNPDQIPEEAQVRLLTRGDDVVIKEFGGEGSGGQSFLRYNWKAGLTYRFLTRVHPDENRAGATVYTSWFFDPARNNWRLIASFSRPQKVTWYKRPHSFLENFIPSQGHLARKVEFGNQWVIDEHGNWTELTKAKFTFDATAKANRRADFDGGVSKNHKSFYLKNCGFFNSSIQAGSFFNREKSGIHPEIDLGVLPNK